jgi:hypothetical protein
MENQEDPNVGEEDDKELRELMEPSETGEAGQPGGETEFE